ncbi:MAG: glycoside hydrolase N-terminal domain-containing protein [[Ruminococcus] torques]
MMKTRMKKLLAGMCAVLILPIGSAQTVLAEEPEQNFPISVEKAVNQTLKLWYGSPAKINTAESSGGEWMQQSLPLGNGNLGNLIFGGISKERIHFNEKNTLDRRSFIEPSQLPVRK